MAEQTGRRALITGSCGGLGAAFAAVHAQRGGDLILSDLNARQLQKQKEALESRFGVRVETIPADLTDPAQTEGIFNTCKTRGLRTDYLICNAGFGGQGSLAARPMEKDMAMLAVNAQAPTRLLKLFLPDMLARGEGRILLVSSVAAKMPGPLQAVYFASKAYLTSLGNAVWQELRGSGVTLTTTMPGILATEFAEKGRLEDTLLFSRRADPLRAAEKSYDAMLRGRLNVCPCVQLPLRLALPLLPFLPKRSVLRLTCMLQKKGASGR